MPVSSSEYIFGMIRLHEIAQNIDFYDVAYLSHSNANQNSKLTKLEDLLLSLTIDKSEFTKDIQSLKFPYFEKIERY